MRAHASVNLPRFDITGDRSSYRFLGQNDRRVRLFLSYHSFCPAQFSLVICRVVNLGIYGGRFPGDPSVEYTEGFWAAVFSCGLSGEGNGDNLSYRQAVTYID